MSIKVSKKLALLVLVTIVILSVAGCGNSNPTDDGDSTQNTDETVASETSEISLTLDELSQYDGKNDNPAYIAVDGIIYDVSKVPQWLGGIHLSFTAGKDVTEEVNDSPHGLGKLKIAPIVGKIVE